MTVLPKRLIVLIMAVAGVALAGPARADSSAPVVTNTSSLAPGVDFSTFQYATASGTATGDLLTVDLADPTSRSPCCIRRRSARASRCPP
jgi:hypothetical protein